MQKLLLFFTWVLATQAMAQPFPVADPADSLELIKLYNSLGGDSNWVTAYKWGDGNFQDPVHQWEGIKLNGDGNVTVIDLDGNPDFSTSYVNENVCSNQPGIGLSGTLPELNFPELRVLSLSFGGIEGPLPAFTGANKLIMLAMSCNNLSGPVPVLDLPFLEELNFPNNNLSGLFPVLAGLPRLKIINLTRNSLLGAMPPSITASQLFSIALRHNKLDGSISVINSPAFSAAGEYIFSDNRLTFEDIWPAVNAASVNVHFEYAPQDSIGVDTVLTLPVGFPYAYDLGVDDTMSTNVYVWYQDGVPYDTIYGSNDLMFDSVGEQHVGVWTCRVSNTRLTLPDDIETNLVLESRPITIQVCYPAVAYRDTTLCPGQVWTVNDSVYNEDRPQGFQKFTGMTGTDCDSFLVLSLHFHDVPRTGPDTLTCAGDQWVLEAAGPAAAHWTTSSGAEIAAPEALITLADGLDEGPNLFIRTMDNPVCPGLAAASFTVFYDRPPRAEPDEWLLLADDALSDSVTANDDLDPAVDTVLLLRLPESGQLDFHPDGTFDFRPAPYFIGKITFAYGLCSPNCAAVYCDSVEAVIYVVPDQTPLVITPDGDGINDEFVLEDLKSDPDRYPQNELVIVDSWGTVVLRRRGYRNDWRGENQHGQPLPQATYYFTFQLDEQTAPVRNRVTVLRR